MRAAKVQASLRIRAVSPEPSLLAHTSSESRGTFRQKARSLAPLNGWACAVKICHDGMLEDTNSLDAAHLIWVLIIPPFNQYYPKLVPNPDILIISLPQNDKMLVLAKISFLTIFHIFTMEISNIKMRAHWWGKLSTSDIFQTRLPSQSCFSL